MKKNISLGPFHNYFPAPVVLVSAKSGEKENFLAIAWCGVVCSEPPMVSVSVRKSRFSHSLIKDSGEFVINVPSEEQLDETDRAGTVSGANIDKFKETGFGKEKSEIVSAPSLASCPIAMECKVKQVLELGSHDCFIAEVVSIRAEQRILSKGTVDFYKLKPIVMLSSEYWGLGEKIEEYGFCGKK